MIVARDLKRSFNGDAVQVLRGVSFTIGRGECVSVMGPSGSGKSTLLNVLGALDNEFEGELAVDGVDLRHLAKPEAFRARTVGFVFQSFHLLPTLTAIENVQVPMFVMPWSGAERRARASELLTSVGLGDRLDHAPSELSGGERQRVAIARSLANKPKLLLADEPTGNLDSANGQKIVEVLRELHTNTHMTLVIVTHDANVAAMGGRTLRMLDGRIVDEAVNP